MVAIWLLRWCYAVKEVYICIKSPIFYWFMKKEYGLMMTEKESFHDTPWNPKRRLICEWFRNLRTTYPYIGNDKATSVHADPKRCAETVAWRLETADWRASSYLQRITVQLVWGADTHKAVFSPRPNNKPASFNLVSKEPHLLRWCYAVNAWSICIKSPICHYF